MVSWGRKTETTLCNYYVLRTGSEENKNKNPEAQAARREICLYKSPECWIFQGDFQVSSCLWILMTCKWVASGPLPTPFLYLALQSQSPGVQILPAWCSSHRNCCCPWSWSAVSLGGKPHHQSYLCRTQLEPGEKKTRTENPQWP